jgi:hypothetical protein
MRARIGHAGAWLLVVAAATCAAIGWLYLLRDAGAIAAGPDLAEALPLQRLAGGDAQPLARIAVAFLPAGLVAGLLLRAAGFRRRLPRALGLLAGSALLLMALGAAADTITASERLADHLAQQPQRPAIWLGAALLALGAAIA